MIHWDAGNGIINWLWRKGRAQPNALMKYWGIIADKLSATGWSWGYCSAITCDGWRWILDAYFREGRR